jgi:putative nucleotidyltransferase with HDIG domain
VFSGTGYDPSFIVTTGGSTMQNNHRAKVNGGKHEDILSKLHASYNFIATLSSTTSISNHIVKTIESLPGVTQCKIYLQSTEKPISHTKNIQVYSISASNYTYGILRVQIKDQKKFAPFNTAVNNFINSIAIILENRRQKKEIERTNHLLSILSKGNHAIIYATDENKLLQQTCDLILKLGEYKFVWIGIAENNNAKSIRPIAKAGQEKGYLNSVKISWDNNNFGNNPIGFAIRTKKSFIEQNTKIPKNHTLWRKEIIARDFNSVASIPLIVDHNILGGITIYSDKFNDFPESNIKTLEEMANDLAFGILTLRRKTALDNAENKSEQLLKNTAGVIALIIEKRDPYTAGHQKRTAALSRAIAKEIGLSDTAADIIHLGATIHDIGKIHIPSELLSYPGKLLPQEMELIRSHPIIGYEIAKHANFPWPEINNIILQHHERLNGSGYPNGLKAKEISLEARIVAVADSIEAMASHRPYRVALGIDAALEEINKDKEELYDASVVETCTKLFKNKNFILPST